LLYVTKFLATYLLTVLLATGFALVTTVAVYWGAPGFWQAPHEVWFGIDASGVLVQAFPTESGSSGGTPSLDGILEADGPAGSGTVAVGCLASGLTYTIAIDAEGDPTGILASTQVTVP
jgi:hypothetical protein